MCSDTTIVLNLQGRIIEVFDAVDAGDEIELVIDGFSIGLGRLQLRAVSFTDRTTTTYTKLLFDTPSVTFDLSFRVQCSENCYGLNCTTFCEPEEGVYTCDNMKGGLSICVGSRNPATNCTTCHISSLHLSTDCTQCLLDFSQLLF